MRRSVHPVGLGLAGITWLAACGLAVGDSPDTAVTEISVPSDLELGSLESRAAEQRRAASGWQVFHDFSFRDRLAPSGITFRHRIVDDAGIAYKAVHYDHGSGLAAADVDGDGRTDLYFVSQIGPNELWRNLGGGRFENVTERAGVALADRIGVSASFADADNDGDPDLFVTTVRGGNALFENLGGSRFRDVTERAGVGYSGHSSGAVFFDYDRDGLLDLFVANVGVYTGDERGRGGYYVGLADAFNGHHYPERGEASILYRNLGGLRFRDVSSQALLIDRSWSGDAAAVDLDDDGFQDLYILDMQGHDRFYRNVEGRFFVDRTAQLFPRTPPGTMGIQLLDWNRDGRLDLFLTDMHADMVEVIGPEREKLKARPPATAPPEVLRESILGNALFEATDDGFVDVSDRVGAETYWPWGLSAGDLNADGWEDVFITGSMNYPFRYGINSVLLNERGRTFRDAEFVLGVEPRAGGMVQPWFELDCPADGDEAVPGPTGEEGAGDPGHGHAGATAEGADPMAAWRVFDDPASARAGGAVGPHADCRGVSGRVVVQAARGSRSSVLFDLDGDGDLDAVTNELNAEPQVLISDLAQRHDVRRLEVILRGTASNRDGLGARVDLVTTSGRRTAVHHGLTGYLSHGLVPLYFGLAADERPLRLEVRWPSGTRQTVEAPAVGRRLEVVEPTPGPTE